MSDFKNIQQRESGLKRELGPKQMSLEDLFVQILEQAEPRDDGGRA